MTPSTRRVKQYSTLLKWPETTTTTLTTNTEKLKTELKTFRTKLNSILDPTIYSSPCTRYDSLIIIHYDVIIQTCFEYKTSEYVYSVCPYEKATQRPANGGSETNLGKWETWSDDFREMKFTKGTKCWNGPDRSTTVKVWVIIISHYWWVIHRLNVAKRIVFCRSTSRIDANTNTNSKPQPFAANQSPFRSTTSSNQIN